MLLTFSMFIYANIVLYFYNHSKDKQKKFFKYLLIIGFVLILGLRGLNGIYSDEYNYRNGVIELIGQPLRVSNIFKLEGGFYLLQWLSAFLFKSDQIFIFLTCLIIYPLLFDSFLRYSSGKDNHLVFSFFILSGSLLSSTNIIRQYVAVAIVVYGLRYLLNGNKKRFFLCVFIGMWFHTSCLICMPFMYILLSTKINIKHIIYLILITVIFSNASIFLPQLLSGSTYIDYIETLNQGMNTLRAAFWILQYSFLIFSYLKIKKSKFSIYYINSAVIAIGLNIASLFFLYASRLTVYFENIAIIGLPFMLSIIKKDQRKFIILIWIIAYMYFAYYQTKGALPYTIFLK